MTKADRTTIEVLAFMVHDLHFPGETYIEPTPEAFVIAQQTLIAMGEYLEEDEDTLRDMLLVVAGAMS